MVTTRSKGKQLHLEDFTGDRVSEHGSGQKQKPTTATKLKSASSKPAAANNLPSPPPRKRKVAASTESKSSTKKVKVEDSESHNNSVLINRAPVLHLWSACVSHLAYPDLAWSTCLSAGSAISTITAVAKGRSIGTIDRPDGDEEERHKKTEQKENDAHDDIIEVMHFKLQIKGNKVTFGGKSQSDREDMLSKKFGGRYDDVKNTFEEALASWSGHEEELQKRAFHMYEKFRPTVPQGQRGWGRKGELNLSSVEKTVINEG